MKSINAMCLVFLSISAGCAGEVVDDPPVESTKQELRPIGGGGDGCESTLASCMNKGGDTDTCWNAYWRCISNRGRLNSVEVAPEESEGLSAPGMQTGATAAALAKVPFCLPGEKVKCTLGPPPVCHCE